MSESKAKLGYKETCLKDSKTKMKDRLEPSGGSVGKCSLGQHGARLGLASQNLKKMDGEKHTAALRPTVHQPWPVHSHNHVRDTNK